MKIKIALILYIILTLGYLVISQIRKSKDIAFIESVLEQAEFVQE